MFYATLGKIVCAWGQFEQHLDAVLRLALALPDVAEFRKDYRQEFKGKLRVWRKVFATSPALQPFSQRAKILADEAGVVSRDRDHILHSSWLGFTNEAPLTAIANNVRFAHGRAVKSPRLYTIDELTELLHRIEILYARVLPFTFEVIKLQPKYRV